MSHHHHAHHSHDHGHHAHSHAGQNFNTSFTVAVGLNTAFVVIEFFYGFWAQSTALMADAGHNLSDVLGLLLAWGAASWSKRSPQGRYTYGWRASSILVAWMNAVLLLVACGAIAWEAVMRLSAPVPVQSMTVMVVAAVGIAVNAVSAWMFMKGSAHDLNLRGAYLHLLADAAVSLGVVLAGVGMAYTGWNWLDPMTSLVIVVVIVAGTWGLLKESFALALAAVPSHIDLQAVTQFLSDTEGVAQITDLHIWAVSTTDTALTAHLLMPQGHPGDAFIASLTKKLHQRFNISHCTLQIVQTDGPQRCALLDDC